IFKSVTGTSIISYRNEMRLTMAKKLLIQTDLSVTDIAVKVGFSSASYFSELFTKRENISPVEYRKYHKK
ncbi:MAG: helix-turn-helix transcriptional regulator, partial [Clostridia bacterium]|nr:helix-turn-helix transcriptional regulator [Clostridia bacterium]